MLGGRMVRVGMSLGQFVGGRNVKALFSLDGTGTFRNLSKVPKSKQFIS
jgi:hypothetical protein